MYPINSNAEMKKRQQGQLERQRRQRQGSDVRGSQFDTGAAFNVGSSLSDSVASNGSDSCSGSDGGSAGSCD